MARGGTTTESALEPGLHAYLLGAVDFEAALRFQRRLHYEVAAEPSQAALVLCEHPSIITVGRQGSRAHIRVEPRDLESRRWSIRWVNRGGGCLLHLPGQLAIYPILPLEPLRLNIPDYLHRLGETLCDLLKDFSIRGEPRITESGVWVRGRLIAAFGVAVRNWVTYFGAYLNVQPCLDPFRVLSLTAGSEEPMTSLERERHGPVRPALVRQRLLEHFGSRFGFARTAFFSDHPALRGFQQQYQMAPLKR
jgi:lipoyl(octanoyl) transferase